MLMKDRQKTKKEERQKMRELDFPTSEKTETENFEKSAIGDNGKTGLLYNRKLFCFLNKTKQKEKARG